jgi:hypothetical protein
MEFQGQLLAVRDCPEPELVLARPLRFFKVSDVKVLNKLHLSSEEILGIFVILTFDFFNK